MSPGLREEHQLWTRVMSAMKDVTDRLPRAQRISMKKAPTLALRSVRVEYDHWMHRQHNTKAALNQLRIFVRLVEEYRVLASAGTNKRWTAYDDQKLRKPIARLKRLLIDSERWEGMRRLISNDRHLAKSPMFMTVTPGTPLQMIGTTNPYGEHFWDQFARLGTP